MHRLATNKTFIENLFASIRVVLDDHNVLENTMRYLRMVQLTSLNEQKNVLGSGLRLFGPIISVKRRFRFSLLRFQLCSKLKFQASRRPSVHFATSDELC